MNIYITFSFRFLDDTFHFLVDYKKLRNKAKIFKSQAKPIKNKLKYHK